MYIIIILLLILLIINIKESFSLESSESLYKTLQNNWGDLFKDGNRNAAGSIFFKWILDKCVNYNEFLEYNKLYCAVSGSLISPGSKPSNIIMKDMNGTKIYGQYYKCCWPCLCDIMKYARVIKMKHKFKNEENDKEFYVITIENPCNKNNFPDEVTKEYFCKGNQINEEKNHIINGRLVIGLLHNGKIATENEIDSVNNDKITGKLCQQRNEMAIEKLEYGMGDIFIKMAR